MNTDLAEVVARIVPLLDRRFGGESWDGTRIPPDPVDSLVRTILSQNTTDQNRERAYQTLTSRFSTWEAVRDANLEDVKDAIRQAGLANQKGPAIQRILKWIQEETGELSLDFIKGLPDEEAVDSLTQHKGIGIKTAYIFLAFACGRDLCAVDTHVHRVLRRVGLIDERCSRERAHKVLAPMIPEGKARAFHVNLVDLGKTVCRARTPDCSNCPIQDHCGHIQAAN